MKIKRTSFFFKLFVVPSILWLSLSLLALIPDETEVEPFTILDLIIADFFIIVVWLIISYVINLIVKEIVKTRPKTIIKYESKPMNKKVEEIIKNEKRAKEKVLYTCKSETTIEEYQEMVTHFPFIYIYYCLGSSIFIFIASLIYGLVFKKIIDSIIFFIVLEVIVCIINKVRFPKLARKSFLNTLKKDKTYDTKFKTNFYDDYFERIGEHITRRICYSDITKFVETDNNIYLQQYNLIYIFQKNKMNDKTIAFFKRKIKNISKKG